MYLPGNFKYSHLFTGLLKDLLHKEEIVDVTEYNGVFHVSYNVV